MKYPPFLKVFGQSHLTADITSQRVFIPLAKLKQWYAGKLSNHLFMAQDFPTSFRTRTTTPLVLLFENKTVL